MSTKGLIIDPNDALHTLLESYRGQHIHFFPKYGNAGDGFISYATYKIFEAYNISFTPHRQEDRISDGVVFIGGGGNLVEGLYNHVADLITAHRHVTQVVVLPHTIVGYGTILEETFGNLTLICRDQVSYQAALANNTNKNKIHLAKDMTFYLQDDHFDEFDCKGNGFLVALREDVEGNGNIDVPIENIDVSRSWDGDIWTFPPFAEYVTKSIFAFVSQFEAVLTDRLHVGIVGSLLKKHVVLLPNSYFKNRAVYLHSMEDRFPLTLFGDTPEARELIASYGISISTRSSQSGSSGPPADETSTRRTADDRTALDIGSIFKKVSRMLPRRS